MQGKGNAVVRSKFEALLPPDYPRPRDGPELEAFIRNKYIQRKARRRLIHTATLTVAVGGGDNVAPGNADVNHNTRARLAGNALDAVLRDLVIHVRSACPQHQHQPLRRCAAGGAGQPVCRRT